MARPASLSRPPVPASRRLRQGGWITVSAPGLALGAALLVSACSGGSTSDAAPTATTTVTTTPSSTATPSQAPPATVTPSTPAGTVTSSAPSPSTPTPTDTPSPTGPAPCTTSQLRITIGGGSGGAAGSAYTAVNFVNTGPAPCTLNGHPGVSTVAGADGTQVGAAAKRDGTSAPVQVAPGAAAHATLRILDYQALPTSRCQPTAFRGYRVYPPDQTASAFVAMPGTTCGDDSEVLLTISPVEAGPPAQ